MYNTKKIVRNILGDKCSKNYSKKDIDSVELSGKRKCDFCGKEAKYDGKTQNGKWAYMCNDCFQMNGLGLGVGLGQRIKYK